MTFISHTIPSHMNTATSTGCTPSGLTLNGMWSTSFRTTRGRPGIDGPWKYSSGTLHVPTWTSTLPAMSANPAPKNGRTCSSDASSKAGA